MSLGANIVLAAFMIVGAIGFAAIGIVMGSHMSAGPLPFYALAAFCVVIATACLVPASRAFTLRIIGAVIFGAYVVYAFATIGDRRFFSALAGLVVWGLPSGYVAIWGMYPLWGRASAAFSDSANANDDDSV